jgi:hypothetical protein
MRRSRISTRKDIQGRNDPSPLYNAVALLLGFTKSREIAKRSPDEADDERSV